MDEEGGGRERAVYVPWVNHFVTRVITVDDDDDEAEAEVD